MSIPTPAPSAVGGTPSTGPLPEVISIQELESGNLNIDALIEEIRILHQRIPALRFQMTNTLRTISTVDDTVGPSLAFQQIQREVVEMKQMLDSYAAQYRRLMPVIRYAKLKAGLNPDDMTRVQRHELEVLGEDTDATRDTKAKRNSTTKARPRAQSNSTKKTGDTMGSASQPILL